MLSRSQIPELNSVNLFCERYNICICLHKLISWGNSVNSLSERFSNLRFGKAWNIYPDSYAILLDEISRVTIEFSWDEENEQIEVEISVNP